MQFYCILWTLLYVKEISQDPIELILYFVMESVSWHYQESCPIWGNTHTHTLIYVYCIYYYSTMWEVEYVKGIRQLRVLTCHFCHHIICILSFIVMLQKSLYFRLIRKCAMKLKYLKINLILCIKSEWSLILLALVHLRLIMLLLFLGNWRLLIFWMQISF